MKLFSSVTIFSIIACSLPFAMQQAIANNSSTESCHTCANICELSKAITDNYYVDKCLEDVPIKARRRGPESQDSKYGYITPQGQELTKFIYDYAYEFNEGLAVVEKDNKYGYIDHQGREVIPLIYDGAYTFIDGIAIVEKAGKWGSVDVTGAQLAPFLYDNFYGYTDGLALVEKEGLFGYINRKGEVEIPLRYLFAKSFENGKAIVNYSYLNDLISDTGKVLLSDIPSKVSRLNKNLFTKTNHKGSVDVFDINQHVYHKNTYVHAVPNYEFDSTSDFSQQLTQSTIFTLKDDLFGSPTYQLMDRYGQIISASLANSDERLVSNNGLIVVNTGKELQLIDESGLIRLSGQFDHIDPIVYKNIAAVKQDDQWQYFTVATKAEALLVNQSTTSKNTVQANPIKIGQPVFKESFDATDLFSDDLVLVKQSDQLKFIDSQGNKVLSLNEKYARPFFKNTSIFITQEDKYGVMDKQGKHIVAAEYDDIVLASNRYFLVEKNNRYGLLDLQGSVVLPPMYGEIKVYDNFALILTSTFSDNKLINLNTMKIYKYDIYGIDDFVDGFATIRVTKNRRGDERGIIDKLGQVTLFEDVDYLENLSEGYFLLYASDSKKIVDTKGNSIPFDQYETNSTFKNGYLTVSKNGLWGAIDMQGKEVIAFKYKELESLDDGQFIAKKGVGIIDQKGLDVTAPIYDIIERSRDIYGEYNDYFEVTQILKTGRKKGLLNADGKLILPVDYDNIESIGQHVYIVFRNNLMGVVDGNGQDILPLEYDVIKSIDYSLLAVSKEGKLWGLTTIEGVEVAPEQYQDVKRHSAKHIAIKQHDKWGLIAKNGAQIVPPIYEEIRNINEGLMVVKHQGQYGYIDSRGTPIIDYKFDEAQSFIGDEAYVEIENKAYKIDKTGKILRKTSIVRAAAAAAAAEARREVRPN